MKIVLVDNSETEGDWEGFYLNGKLVTQGHSHAPDMVLEALGIPFERREESHYLEECGRLPDQLSELDEQR